MTCTVEELLQPLQPYRPPACVGPGLRLASGGAFICRGRVNTRGANFCRNMQECSLHLPSGSNRGNRKSSLKEDFPIKTSIDSPIATLVCGRVPPVWCSGLRHQVEAAATTSRGASKEQQPSLRSNMKLDPNLTLKP